MLIEYDACIDSDGYMYQYDVVVAAAASPRITQLSFVIYLLSSVFCLLSPVDLSVTMTGYELLFGAHCPQARETPWPASVKPQALAAKPQALGPQATRARAVEACAGGRATRRARAKVELEYGCSNLLRTQI